MKKLNMLLKIKIFEIENNLSWNLTIISTKYEISKVFEFIRELQS